MPAAQARKLIVFMGRIRGGYSDVRLQALGFRLQELRCLADQYRKRSVFVPGLKRENFAAEHHGMALAS